MNRMKITMKAGTEFSSNSPENSTLYTVERGGYLYPWASAGFSYTAPFQLIYSSLTTGFRVKL